MNPGESSARVIPADRSGRLRAVLIAALAIAVALILVGTFVSIQGEWIVRSVFIEDQSTSLVDMAIDGFDRIHVLYATDYGVFYTILGGHRFSFSSPGGIVGMALDVDGTGSAHFVYVGSTPEPNISICSTRIAGVPR